ncbi:hypothetical protein [Acinetobacter sp.]|uniref:hypothetical protein n=1 Tax=Acinetobacter sp. TaxID=472 RepID=UPI003CFF446B
MKKKFSAFDIIGLGVISYLICIIFGLVSKHVFNLGEVDILSSSATLFAGIVALILFNDWREQYRIDLFFKLLEGITVNLSNFDHKLDALNLAVMKANSGQPFKKCDIMIPAKELQKAFDVLIPDFILLKKLFDLRKIDVEQLNTNPFDLEKDISQLTLDLLKVHVECNNDIKKIVPGYWKLLENSNLKIDVLTVKYLLNQDLQDILLKDLS